MKVLFDFRRPYFLSAYISLFAELEKRGVYAAVCPMQEEYYEAFASFIEHQKYSVKLVPCSAPTDEKWDLILVSGALYERTYRVGQHVGRLCHGGCVGNSQSMYYASSILEHNMDAYFALSSRDIFLAETHHPGIWKGRIVKIVGWPKLDRVFPIKQIDRGTKLRALGLDPGKQTVVVTSHWTENSLIRTIGLNLIATLGQLQNYNVIVTAHPLVFSDVRQSLADDPERVIGTLCNHPHMRFYPTHDSTELLPLGNIFICDYSSITYELCALGIPVLLYCDAHHEFIDLRLQKMTLAATYCFSAVQQIAGMLEWIITHPDEKQFQRAALTQHVYANLGKATAVAVDAIISVCEELHWNETHKHDSVSCQTPLGSPGHLTK